MLRQAEKEWALSIGPDTVRMFVLKAKAISAAVNDDYSDGTDHEVEYDGDRGTTITMTGSRKKKAKTSPQSSCAI